VKAGAGLCPFCRGELANHRSKSVALAAVLGVALAACGSVTEDPNPVPEASDAASDATDGASEASDAAQESATDDATNDVADAGSDVVEEMPIAAYAPPPQ
jgi:hypothetical protein